MARGRKNGCPTNIRDWLVYILDKSSTTERWVRIFGLTSLSYEIDSDTEDGSAETDIWAEPYVTKRSATLSLEGDPVVDADTGDPDEGQSMLDAYAEQAFCDADATIKFIDPYGHARVADYIVTSTGDDSDTTEDSCSWDLEQVGEPEILPYINVASVALRDGETALTALSMQVGDAPKVVNVVFTPDNASNQRFRVNISGRRRVAVSSVTENSFTVSALSAGEATVTVTTVSGKKTASVKVTVTESSGA